ncbi:MAG TPA: glucosaminidase domain-containing protein [Silvibacterium sp.]|nr:glucosaminidase domain-containing protein [Silvibacterium sp.]
MEQITQAVGQGQPNRPEDVRLIQALLNQRKDELGMPAPLDVDGLFGPRTASLIEEFQRCRKLPTADGIVHPAGPTFRALNSESGSPVSSQSVKVPAHVTEFVNKALPAARKVKEQWNVPVSVLLAQAAIESAWGKHVKGNAYFGIKGKSRSGASTKFATTEFINNKKVGIEDEFRAYADFEEAADDYGRFLNENPRYRGAFDHTQDPAKFAKHIAKAGYATDPEYHTKIVSIIRRFSFDQYDV